MEEIDGSSNTSAQPSSTLSPTPGDNVQSDNTVEQNRKDSDEQTSSKDDLSIQMEPDPDGDDNMDTLVQDSSKNEINEPNEPLDTMSAESQNPEELKHVESASKIEVNIHPVHANALVSAKDGTLDGEYDSRAEPQKVNGTLQPAADGPRVRINRRAYTQSQLDDKLDKQVSSKSVKESTQNYLQSKCICSGECVKNTLYNMFPFIDQLRTYQWKNWLLYDFLSGLSVGAIHVPQSMGFALLTSVPAVNGLYTSLFVVLFYYFLATSRHISMGSMAVVSLMIGAVVERETDGLVMPSNFNGTSITGGTNITSEDWLNEKKVDIAMSVSILVGLFQILMGVLRMGIIANYMSIPFVRGFLTGAAVHIVTSQIPSLFGIKMKPITGIFKIPKTYIKVLGKLPDATPGDIVTTIICMFFLILVKEIINEKFKHKLKIPIPAELLLVVISTLISYLAKLNDNFNITIVGSIPKGIPSPELPSMTNYTTYIVDAFVIAIVAFAIGITMAKMMSQKHKYQIDSNQELVAYGVSNGLGSFFHCFAGTQAPPRTLVHEAVGGKTQVASLFSCALLLIVCLWLGPLFESLPKAALASIIVVALFPLFKHFLDLKQLWFVNKWDMAVWIITCGSVVFLDISVGLGIGMLSSMIAFLLQAQFHNARGLQSLVEDDLFGRSYGSGHEVSGIKIFHFHSPIFFANAETLKQQVLTETIDVMNTNEDTVTKKGLTNMGFTNDHTDQLPEILENNNDGKVNSQTPDETTEKRQILKCIILDCAGVTYVDMSGLNTLNAIRKTCKESRVEFVLTSCSSGIINKLRHMDIISDKEDSLLIYPTIQDAVSMIGYQYSTYVEDATKHSSKL